ncbi:BadF/BadG/BcrA/BcrD ATPase family protein [Desulfosporosinus sp. BICA1-9]|uniref:BadF/BadG/BcrA/BcrD ATPase family protein n=1 Tax=Desulfosporosinus sp. BICA1-9 TaxID=1531958 RepID=UPI00054B4E0C|nr:BadF/BadG/BcrA/BcrD ATPase family protein [Desulfosporosinus sp. BICA1-9]KJS48231.1 MAG: hypothetical protein VR66_15200 [Peptococcaceae bacterium BRH_c23]KJS83292.1 MAG: hypothetical protein JL57_23015 [Desulfosporosinus sp. BICA1-9]HBW38203.1 hypothetical protein [Desulfosporosinus sp.]
MYTLGVDIGSTTSKAVILKDGKTIVKKALVPLGTGTSGPSQVFQKLFADQELKQRDIVKTVVTGYGRMTLSMLLQPQ